MTLPKDHTLVNLIAHLGDPRFNPVDIHHEIEALDRTGVTIQRENHAPEALLSWIDAEFDGVWSFEVSRSGAYYALDARGFCGFAAYDARTLDYRWLRPYASENDIGIFGPIGVSERARGTGLGTLLARAAMFGLRERGYRRALIPAAGPDDVVRWYERETGARVADRFSMRRPERRYRATVLAGGNGSNFAAVAEAAAAGDLPIDITAVVSNKAGAKVLERAAAAGIASHVVVWDRVSESRADYDARVMVEVAMTEPDIVLMLGWMHILPELCVKTFACLNLHPAFLPFDPAADTVTMPDGSVSPVFRGGHAIDDALAAKAAWTGASFHRVGSEVDRGPVLARLPLRIAPGESKDELRARLTGIERKVVAAGIDRWTWEQK